jgi:predicted amidohydrolase YtcJ
MFRLVVWLALPAVLVLAACAAAPRCDRLFVGGVVHASGDPVRREIAVEDGRIVALVPPERSAAWRRAAREVVDLAGAHVYPGFTESHGHLASYGAALEGVDLSGAADFAEVVARVAKAAVAMPAGAWVVGRGWDQNDWPDRRFPHRAALSRAVPDHPVLLRRVDGHAVLLNAAGLRLAGISAATADPSGGRILREANGEPTGVLVDTAAELAEKALPPPSPASVERQVLKAAERLVALGFTEFHDAFTDALELETLRRLWREGRLPLRVWVMLDGNDDALLDREFAAGPQVSRDGMLTVRAVKLFADGALGSRGAWLSQPYSDEPSSRGLEVTPLARLLDVVRRAARAGFQPCIHAIGDAAVTRVLDVYEKVLGPGGEGLRPRMEHAQIVRPEDVPRFAPLGVVASVQTTHCTADMPWAPDRLGPQRIAWAYRWRSLLDAGVHLCLGSDAPVEDPDPRLGIWAAVTRRPPEGTPREGWNMAEALTANEAIAGYTSGAAYAGHEENWRGRLEPTFAADLTVVDRDLEADGGTQVLRARILRTVIAGRDAFVAGGGS